MTMYICMYVCMYVGVYVGLYVYHCVYTLPIGCHFQSLSEMFTSCLMLCSVHV